MVGSQIKCAYLDFYTQNRDWKERTVEDNYETIHYQNGSTVRIWYNCQTSNYAPHWHTALEIIMPVENYYDAVSSDKPHHILPGDILIIPPGEIHYLIAPDSGKRFIFQFDISNIARLKGFAGLQSVLTGSLHITHISYPQIYEDVRQLLMQMRNEYFSSNEFSELVIYSHLLNLFVTLGRNRLNNINLFSNVRIYKQKEYMQKFNTVLNYIDAHYREELCLDDVAAFSGFSKFHFTRLFKQYTDSTFYDYLSFKRIKAAENLLAQPNLSITEIALSTGFSSISTFNRIFKQQKKCTPSEYRSLCYPNTST